MNQASQLHLPVIVGESIPILYVRMDGTGVPVVKKETEGRAGKADGQPADTREVKFGCTFTQTGGLTRAIPFATPAQQHTPVQSKPPAGLEAESIWRPGIAAGIAPRRKSSSETEPNG